MSSQGRYPFISAGSAVIKIENVIFNRVGAACEKTLPLEQEGISAHSYPLAIHMYFRRSGVSQTQARGQTLSKSFASHFRFRQLAPARRTFIPCSAPNLQEEFSSRLMHLVKPRQPPVTRQSIISVIQATVIRLQISCGKTVDRDKRRAEQYIFFTHLQMS